MTSQRPTGDATAQATSVPARRLALAFGAVAAIAAAIVGVVVLRAPDQPVDRAAAPVADVVPVHRPGVLFRNADGLVVTVPEGLAQQRHPFELPPTIRMSVGQRIEVRNEDEIAHVVFGMVVPPGGSKSMTLERAGVQVYSAGCAVHVTGSGLTTLMVSESEGAS